MYADFGRFFQKIFKTTVFFDERTSYTGFPVQRDEGLFKDSGLEYFFIQRFYSGFVHHSPTVSGEHFLAGFFAKTPDDMPGHVGLEKQSAIFLIIDQVQRHDTMLRNIFNSSGPCREIVSQSKKLYRR